MTAANYQAIIFDVGGTLLEITRNPHELSVEAVAHLGVLSPTSIEKTVRSVVQEWSEGGGRPEAADLSETWIEHYRRALSRLGFAGDIEDAARIIERSFLSEGWAVYSDAVDAVADLRDRGFRMGVVSNWPTTLEVTLERAGLRHYFDVVVGSANVGYAKPHPQIFRIAMEHMDISPRDALYIGDSMEHDVAGARSAGMDVVLLDRAGSFESHEPRIQSLAELSGWISSSSTKAQSSRSQ